LELAKQTSWVDESTPTTTLDVMNADNDSASNERRRFFRELSARMLRPLADYIEPRLPTSPRLVLLRPPGAIDETRFVDHCQRCGRCVEVCPANAIRTIRDPDPRINGTPFVDPDQRACVVCEGLQCTNVCPSGALNPLAHPWQIEMGVAEVYESLCVRSAGESCTICVDRCPLGATAIRFDDDGPPTVLSPGCVGCGVCQELCPTTPKAIVVRPR
jgi:ferredoxin-type protein NapG